MDIQFEPLLQDVFWPGWTKQVSPGEFSFPTSSTESLDLNRPGAGCFYSSKVGGLVPYLSELEYKFAQALEHSELVSSYFRKPVAVPYEMWDKTHEYYPDFLTVLRDSRVIIAAVVPAPEMARRQNWNRWRGLRRYCQSKGYGFLVSNGTRTFQQVARHPVRSNICDGLLSLVAQGWASKAKFARWREQSGMTDEELFATVIRNRLDWTERPFCLARITDAPEISYEKWAKFTFPKPKPYPFSIRDYGYGSDGDYEDRNSIWDEADLTDASPWDSIREAYPEMTQSDDLDGYDWDDPDIDDYPEPTDSIDERTVEDLLFGDYYLDEFDDDHCT